MTEIQICTSEKVSPPPKESLLMFKKVEVEDMRRSILNQTERCALEVPGYDNEINEIFSTYVARIITYLLSSKNIIYQSLDAYENINYIGQLG